MAKVGNSIFDIQGRLGDLVYYRYRGKSMVRKVPHEKETIRRNHNWNIRQNSC